MAKVIRNRAWVFTLNNWTEADLVVLSNLDCSYIVYGKEVGEQGTPHLQGYVEFDNAKTMSAIKKKISDRVHLETRKGTPLQASTYCKKDGDFIERGTISNQGARTDIQQVADAVREGGVQQVVREMPEMFVKFGRNIERLAELMMKPRDTRPKVVWLWGLSGVGKTHHATDCDEYYIWNKSKWWNGYRQQKRIVVDDYSWDGTDVGFRYMLTLLDKYAIQVETKGGMVWVNSPEIYITCEHPPELVFSQDNSKACHKYSENSLRQVLRRIDEVIHLEDAAEDPYGDNKSVTTEDIVRMVALDIYGDDGFPVEQVYDPGVHDQGFIEFDFDLDNVEP